MNALPSDSLASRPPHVPKSLEYDFDVYHPPGAEEDYQRAWKRLHDDGAPDILWTPRNGGHWLPIRGKDIYHLYQDTDNLSTAHYVVPKQSTPFRIIPVNLDPPEHAAYRALFQQSLTPSSIAKIEDFARLLIRDRIEAIREAKRCEFITEFANHVPVGIFLKMTGLPQEDGPMILGWAEEQIFAIDEETRVRSLMKIADYMESKIKECRGRPIGSDRLSVIVNSKVDGRFLTDEELKGMCSLLLIGGLDTVASMMGFIMHFLAVSPTHRSLLAKDPTLIQRALDEFLRRFGLTIPGRVVRKDFTYKGVHFKEGEMMVLPTMMHGLDEREFSNPLEVDYFRKEKPIYSTFGNGVHRCPGTFLARTELRLLLEEWLKGLPDFHLEPGKRISIRTGLHGSITHLPLAWH